MKDPTYYETELAKYKLCNCTTLKEVILIQKHFRYIREEIRNELKTIKIESQNQYESSNGIKGFFRLIGGRRAEKAVNRATKSYLRKDTICQCEPYKKILKSIEIKLLAGDRMKLKYFS